MNQLFYGDNLHVLREHLADTAVGLIYPAPLRDITALHLPAKA